MKLYLASSFRGRGVAKMIMDDIERGSAKPAGEIRVAYITTAGNLHPRDRREWIDEGREIMKKRGWQVFDYDIEGETQEEVARELAEQDVVFVQGGNNYYLLQKMQECHFDEVVKKVLAKGVPYVGESAGSIVCGKDLTMQRYMSGDSWEKAPELTNFQGMGLVNFLVKPHWNRQDAKREKFARFLHECPEEFFSIDQPIICLNDNQLVYVEDDKFQIWEG